jgi:hypothetical protein
VKRRSAPVLDREGIAYFVEIEKVSDQLGRILDNPVVRLADGIGGIKLMARFRHRRKFGDAWVVRSIQEVGRASTVIEEITVTGENNAVDLSYRLLQRIKLARGAG